jgi:hypothetical protein
VFVLLIGISIVFSSVSSLFVLVNHTSLSLEVSMLYYTPASTGTLTPVPLFDSTKLWYLVSLDGVSSVTVSGNWSCIDCTVSVDNGGGGIETGAASSSIAVGSGLVKVSLTLEAAGSVLTAKTRYSITFLPGMLLTSTVFPFLHLFYHCSCCVIVFLYFPLSRLGDDSPWHQACCIRRCEL